VQKTKRLGGSGEVRGEEESSKAAERRFLLQKSERRKKLNLRGAGEHEEGRETRRKGGGKVGGCNPETEEKLRRVIFVFSKMVFRLEKRGRTGSNFREERSYPPIQGEKELVET